MLYSGTVGRAETVRHRLGTLRPVVILERRLRVLVSGVIGKVVLAGNDPFFFLEKGVPYEIGHMSATEDRPSGGLVYSIAMSYDRMRDIHVDEALVRALAVRLKVNKLFVSVHADTWFQERTPIVYPFAPAIPPPVSEPTYKTCSMMRKRIWCSHNK